MVRIRHVLALLCLVVALSPAESQNFVCSLCPLGRYKNNSNNFACAECPMHTYQDVLGATSATQCKPCPANSYTTGVASTSMAACLCAAGYSGDVGNYSMGVAIANLARACTGPCVTSLNNMQSSIYNASNAIDEDMGTYSVSRTVQAGDEQFVGIQPFWSVKFEREAVVQSVKITNYNSQKMTNFYIRVGSDQNWRNMNTLTACAGPLTWTAGSENTYTCNSAIRGRYLYVINGVNEPVILNTVQVRGYLMSATEPCAVCSAGSYKIATGPGICTSCAAGKKSEVLGSTANTCSPCPGGTYSGAGAPNCSSCPSHTNSLPSSTDISFCSCDMGYTAAPNLLTCTAFQSLYAAKKPWAHYTAANWNDVTKTLLDQSGNNRNSAPLGARDAIVQAETVGTTNGNAGPLTYIRGSTSTQLFFPEGSIPVQFTICSVTRYGTSINQNRILTASPQDWLHGHYNQKRGVAYYGSRDVVNASTGAIVKRKTFNTEVESVGRIDPTTGQVITTDWMVMCSKNGGSTPLNILVGGLGVGTSTRSDSDANEWGGTAMDRASQLCINCRTSEKSDWELAHLMIWETQLSDVEMNTVSQELLRYVPTNTACVVTESSECDACVPGKYKTPSGPDQCTSCTSGKYQQETGAVGANQCLLCPQNTNAPASSGNLLNCTCLAGYESLADGVACTACVAGKYKTAPGSGLCTSCPAKTYSTIVAQNTSQCTSCPAFSSGGGANVSYCICDAGYKNQGLYTCLPCESGSYWKGYFGANSCERCPNNTYSGAVAANSSSTCKSCQGNSTSAMGSDESTDCHCLAGYLTKDLGYVNATCQQCSAGSYNPTMDATTCSKCEGGYQSSSPGAVSREQCVGCAANKWSPAGAAQCEFCPNNTAAPALSDEITDCKCLVGYVSSEIGQDGRTCQACPAGTFKSQVGSAACTTCPANSFSTIVAATSNTSCQASSTGSVCPVGTNDPSLCGCDTGYYGYTIMTPVGNLARSCGAGQNQACAVTGNMQNGGASFSKLNDGVLNYQDPGTTQAGSPGWIRIDFSTTKSLTGVQFLMQYCVDVNGCQGNANNWYISIGDGETWNDARNNVCKSNILNPYTVLMSATPVPWLTVNCDAVYNGRYMFLYRTGGVLGFPEVVPFGNVIGGSMCVGCTAGKYKSTIGSMACTNCRADTYSGQLVARNESVCTPCYANAVSDPGSDSIDDCGCSSGFEWS